MVNVTFLAVALAIILKCVFPVGYVADVTQSTLHEYGFRNTGTLVRAGGNILGAAFVVYTVRRHPDAMLTVLFNTLYHPVGYSADMIQIFLEKCGHIGAGGNILGGVLVGYKVDGPRGAILWGVIGPGVWRTGVDGNNYFVFNYFHCSVLALFIF